MADDGLQAALVEALRDLWAEEAGEEIPDDSEVAEVTTRYAVVLAADPRVRAAMDRRAAEELESWARTFRVCGQAGLRRDSRRIFPQVADVLEAGASDLRADDLAPDQP